jgi:hypothetical protein
MYQPNYSRDPLRHASSVPNGRFLVQPVTFWLVARRFLALSLRGRGVNLFHFIFELEILLAGPVKPGSSAGPSCGTMISSD